jgi:hypothetical protein
VNTTGRDDRVLPPTRWLAIGIIPFLLVGFVDLYFWPGETGKWFAWPINRRLTAMLLASAYAGGAYFFARAARAERWHTIKGGFLPVSLFAGLLGLATIKHWDKFNHRHVAFWLWAGLYFTTPFIVAAVWWSNQRHDTDAVDGELLLPGAICAVIAVSGAAALLTSGFLFLLPLRAIRVWPWLLTPLTARVMGAILSLGVAGLGAIAERRWSAVRLMVQVELVMLALMAIGTVRARADINTSRPLSTLFVIGLVTLIAVPALLYAWMERRAAS